MKQNAIVAIAGAFPTISQPLEAGAIAPQDAVVLAASMEGWHAVVSGIIFNYGR